MVGMQTTELTWEQDKPYFDSQISEITSRKHKFENFHKEINVISFRVKHWSAILEH